ncbi:MAG: benzoate-CoA ligase family protein [Hyphomicrobiales bacterium]|nr:benzoate-CoA ligase family protein [Hyphomicrobiales bacterium]
MNRSGLVDTFAADHLPPRDAWPVLLLGSGGFDYPARLNVVTELLDRWVEKGEGGRVAIFFPGGQWNYAELAERVNRIANVLTGPLGLVPGNRVLLRAPNTAMMVASYLAVLKAGLIAVPTMPMMRAKELKTPLEKARVHAALCLHTHMDELEAAIAETGGAVRILTFGTDDCELERLMAQASPSFHACDTASDDVCLFAFTSGTTGGPKATMHFHRDLLAIADGYARHILAPTPDDRFIGSPPLAFTFGLGGLVIFPMRFGASVVLPEKSAPDDLLEAFRTYRPTIVFTAPTAYRAMAGKVTREDIASLRICVSAGEGLPRTTLELWREATGLTLMDGIGSTEMLHIFIASPPGAVRPGATGKPVPGYEARIIDENGDDVPDGQSGLLAVRGPTGCRYLADHRQAVYVRNGWNVTGDTYVRDADGYFWYQARSDDMIISAGYNISGPEVEEALLTHPAVAECGVVGQPDDERGTLVTAVVVLRPGYQGDATLIKALQDHVKTTIAPYKYPRKILFVKKLPTTVTGKLSRTLLRQTLAKY